MLRVHGCVPLSDGGLSNGGPAILDGKHPGTRLIIQDCHAEANHGSSDMRAKPRTPLMAPLPPARGAYRLRTFSHCGLDYFEPMGANNKLREILAGGSQRAQSDFAASRSMEWRFNPPHAPHMGGACEQLVRSVKTALTTVLKAQAPREEVLLTLLAGEYLPALEKAMFRELFLRARTTST